jgi:hypothetical protein
MCHRDEKEIGMRLAILPLMIACGLIPSVAKGQLYLITGSPGYASDLLEIREGGVQNTTEILAEEVGMEWAAISYEWGEAVVLSQLPEYSVLVIDLKEGTIVKRCTVPGLPKNPIEAALTDHWLAAVPGGGSDT